MMDIPTVCCMCGDVGFPEKIFRCTICRNRFQHSYCSNYYSEAAEPIELCDWCQSEQTKTSSQSPTSSSRHCGVGSSSKKAGHVDKKMVKRITDQGNGEQRGKDQATGAPSPRPATRRYKLLKDVMC